MISRKGIAFVLWGLLPFLLQAQPKTEWGIFAGGANYQGDLVEFLHPTPEETKMALGGFVRFPLGYPFALRLNAAHGTISGADRNFKDPSFQEYRGFSFDTDITDLAFLLEWDPFNKRRYRLANRFKPSVTPYFFTGAAGLFIDPLPDFDRPESKELLKRIEQDQTEDIKTFRFAVPVGGGVKLDLSRVSTIGLEVSTRYAFTDYLDGISHSGNPDANDWLWWGGMNLTFRFLPRDKDNDGIADKEDACPLLAGVLTAKGCPDKDGDGVEDAEDICPDLPGEYLLSGCPDADKDGIMDQKDECPGEFGFEETGGCPDRDNDCIADKDDACPDEEGLPEFQGCPDSDGDGIPDKDDFCPEEPGLPEEKGCQPLDTDCDGLPDKEDECPMVEGSLELKGCPDEDGDGIADHLDICPEQAGKPENRGCPEIQKEEREILANATYGIQFQTGSAVLLAESLKILDQIAEILRKYPHYSLKIEGYTDSRGNDKANQTLSERRARACYDYLLYNGISPKRMEYFGFGEKDPVADNNTAEGRKKNRRVEFELWFPE